MSIPYDGSLWQWHGPGSESPDKGNPFSQRPHLYMKTDIDRPSISGNKIKVNYNITLVRSSYYSSEEYYGFYVKVFLRVLSTSGNVITTSSEIIDKGAAPSQWSDISKSGSFTYDGNANIGKLVLVINAACQGCGGGDREYEIYSSAKVSGSPPKPSKPSISANEPLVGDNAKVTGSANEFCYRVRNKSGSFGSYTSWKSGSDNKSKQTSADVSAVTFKARNKTTDYRYTSPTSYSDEVTVTAYTKLLTASAVEIYQDSSLTKKNSPTNNHIMYGQPYYGKFVNNKVNNGKKNPTDGITANYTYNPYGINGDKQKPPYSGENYAQAVLKRSYFKDSNQSLVSVSDKAYVKLNKPPIPSVVTPITIGEEIVPSGNHGSPVPNGSVLHFNWYKGSSKVQNDLTKLIVKGNDYTVKSYDTWKSGRYALIDSDESNASSRILVNRCPRDMKNNFNCIFEISRDGNDFTGFGDIKTVTPEGRKILTLDNNVYLSWSQFSPGLHLGRFNYYKVEFINSLGDPVIEVSQSNNPGQTVSRKLMFNLYNLVINSQLVPGQYYRLKLTCCYLSDSADEDFKENILFDDPSSSNENNKGISGSNVFYATSSPFLLGGQPEPPEILYPGLKGYTTNKTPCILFKVYNPEYLTEITERIKNIKITIGSREFIGTLLFDDDQITQYFSNEDYSKGFEISLYDNGPEKKLGRRYATRGSIVAFRLPSDALKNELMTKVKISCTNKFDVYSEVTEVSFTYVNPLYVSKREEASGSLVVELCNRVIKYLKEYRYFTYINPEDESQGSLYKDISDLLRKGSYSDSDVKGLILPDETSTTDQLLVTSFQSLRYTYNEVQRLTLSKSNLDFVKRYSREDIVADVNYSRYRYLTSSFRGTLKFRYDGTKWQLDAGLRTVSEEPLVQEPVYYNINLSGFGITVTSSTPFRIDDWFEVETVEEHYVDPGLSGVAPRDPDDDPQLDNSYVYQNSPIVASRQDDEDYYKGNLFNQIVDILAHML